MKKLALRESNAGLRVHHRGRPTERLYDGTWPALVAREDWERVTARLTAPERRTNAVARPGARKHLLTWGIGECGVCHGKLRAATKQGKHGKPMLLYVCDDKGCVGRNEAKVDDLVERTVVRAALPPGLRSAGWPATRTSRARLAKQIAKLQTQVDDAADRFADGKWTATQVDRVNERLLPKIEELRAQQRRTLSTLDM